ncbi:AAA family ATPase [Pseudomonas oryzihabitans]|uniref:AAA family ATPase n=1 Tax=Pseudomonas oryzihabitans TaxID=47885 RepID=UPI0011A1D276|nr:ATP-binding protein [Pseudomonas psychrotolerans]
MINGYSEEEFGTIVHEHVRPAEPISSIELLKGRHKELEDIRRALFAKGRHMFIYGDRGIGKSSLAQTAALQYQSSDSDIIQIGCTRTSTFYEIMQSIAASLVDNFDSKEVQTKAGVNLKFLSFEFLAKSSTKPDVPSVCNMEQALDVISDIREIHSEKPIIVVDEFDAIQEAEERYKFAEFLKKMGDSGIYVPIIFSGISASLDDVLGGHQSSIRQLFPIQLSPISWDSRWDILVEALEALNIEYEDEIKYRVAGISDGFPYYVHLITEQLLWAVYDDSETLQIANFSHYNEALKKAVETVQEHIRKPYDLATTRHSQDFHHALWACADTSILHRKTDSIYASYERIIRDLNRANPQETLTPIDRKKFSQRLNTLTKPSHGSVLKKMSDNRTGWYQFSENMLRGYVRLLAETNGVQLWMDEAKVPKQLINPRPSPMGSNRRFQSSIPIGIGLKDDKKS